MDAKELLFIELNMEKNWSKIYTHVDENRLHILESVLKDHHIQVVRLNKKDSSYLNFGEIELYVHENDFEKALEIIIKNDL